MKVFFVPRGYQAQDVWLDPERVWHDQQMPRVPTVQLADLVEVVTDTWSPLVASKVDTFTYIDISSIDVSSGRIAEVKVITAEHAPVRARRLVQAGDVLVSTVRPERGCVAIVPKSLDGAVASTAFLVLRPMHTSPAILWAWLRAEEVRQRLSAGATGVTYPAVRHRQILQLPIPVHSRDEFSGLSQQVQQIIDRSVPAATSDRASVQKPSLLREFGIKVQRPKESFFWIDRSLLSADRLDPESYAPHLTDLVRCLHQLGHPVVPLGAITTVMAGAPTRSAGGDAGVPILRVRNLRDGRLDLIELAQAVPTRDTVPVAAGDILVNVSGVSTGEAALVPPEAEGLPYDNNLALVRVCKSGGAHQVEPAYLVAYLNSDLGQLLISREVLRHASPRLSLAGLRALPVVLPSIAEQRRIAAAFEAGNAGLNLDADTARLVELAETITRKLSQNSRR